MNKICDNMCLKWGDEVGLAKQKSFCKKRKMQNSAASSLQTDGANDINTFYSSIAMLHLNKAL